ncbi:MAG: DUF5615 family PIN-like protein [Chloroflexi bacterium]|nr:DUF5615 family PIN-like protein [Chloroflexota bacterium]
MYLDEDLSYVIAQVGRDRFGLDVVDAHTMGMEHAPDNEQIVFAARERRCIVTRSGDDFLASSARPCARRSSPPSGGYWRGRSRA